MDEDGSFDRADSGDRTESGGKAIAWACRQAVVWGVIAVAILIGIGRFGPQATPVAPPIAPLAVAPLAVPPLARNPAVPNTMVYPAGSNGHVQVDADVDGAVVHFVVDTGATMVTLTPRDAEAAGIGLATLSYSMAMDTANGRVRAAPVTLRGVRLGQLTIDDVQGVVVPNLSISLLGMSFLSRLDRWEMRGGALTISY